MKANEYNECIASMLPIRDALEVISGKWKLLIITSISVGNNRFTEIQRSIPNLSSKVLARELKELQLQKLIAGEDSQVSSARLEYKLLPYAETLSDVLRALKAWGMNHRNYIMKLK